MDKKSVDKALLLMSIILFLIMSASFLLMPLDIYKEELQSSSINIISGLCFWISLLAGCMMQFIITKRRKRCGKDRRQKQNNKKRIGAVSFFENKLAMAADLIMLAAFIACIAMFAFTSASGYVCYIIFAVFVFSFCMHCVLNGKNFRFAVGREDET